jgi:hypothetical protein
MGDGMLWAFGAFRGGKMSAPGASIVNAGFKTFGFNHGTD